MRPGSMALNLYRGDTYRWQFNVYKDTALTPADLTGVTAKAEIRTTAGGTVLVAMPCVVTQPNKIAMTLNVWTGVTIRIASWDLELTYPGGDVITILAGPVTPSTSPTPRRSRPPPPSTPM